MNRILNIAFWIITLGGLVVILGFVSHSQSDMVCSGILIKIDRSNGNYFINEREVENMLFHELDTIIGRPLRLIPSEELEFKVKNHPSVSSAEAYKTLDGFFTIEVKQRTPIVRVFPLNGSSYYIDSIGKIMPTSKNFTSHVLVASGYINSTTIDQENLNDTSAQRSIINEIFAFADFIRRDEFWEAQIEQLYVNKEFEIELIPRVGNHRIVFGDAASLNEKFEKLKVFYLKGLSKTGWNEYSSINLKFADQVVCTKR